MRLGSNRVGLRRAAVLLEGGVEAAHKRVEAAPRLPERARARRRRRWVAEGARQGVHLGLAELVEVLQELQRVRIAAPAQLQQRTRPTADSGCVGTVRTSASHNASVTRTGLALLLTRCLFQGCPQRQRS
jgi:hypothetical protein